MKKLNLLVLVMAVVALSGCSVIGGIFKAGAAVGIISVIVVILLIIWLISAFRGRQ
ncbi:phosphatidate cytidylyltransferase [Inquilinus sp. KBS0705]|nr:phosphatidate cytidylyltransferase [Inquilinus sp. KBS0705]